MSDLQVEGAVLKKMLKIAKKMPLPFGFNPSPQIQECYLALHRIKAAKMLGKDAKDEGSGEKSAFGTLKVEKKLLILDCERVVPNLAKTLKKYLKSQNVILNIEVRDENGNVLDADVEEDLPDDPDMEGDVEDEDDDGIDSSALAKRLAELRNSIQALDPSIAEKLSAAYTQVVGLFKKDELEQCVRGADQIEAALAKAKGSAAPDPALAKLVELYKLLKVQGTKITDDAKRSNIEKALAQAAAHLKGGKVPEATDLLGRIRDAIRNALSSKGPAAPTAPDPKTLKLAQLLASYRKQLEWITDETARNAIESDLKLTAEQIKSGNLDEATALLVKARDAMQAAIAAAKRAEDLAKEQQRLAELPDAPEDAPLSPEQTKLFEEWTKVHNELADRIDNAMTKGLVADVDGLRKDWNWSVNNAADKNYTEALKNIPAVRKMLKAGTEDGKSVFTEDIPADVKPFAESRVRWSFARSKMQSEMEKLKNSIISAVKDDEELRSAVASNINVLTDHLLKLDDRLEDKLDKIVNETAGAKRDGFKDEARTLLSEYRMELENEFFQDVDSNSGFGNVSIAATAQAALGAIEAVLR